MSEGELAQRAAILSQLKDLLNQQIKLFRKFLSALEKQHTAIEAGIEENILAYIEIEEQIVADILSIQKVIDSLEDMYRATVPDDISTLKSALENLKNQAMVQSEHNKGLISARMTDIGGDIDSLKNNLLAIATRRSMYHNAGTALLVDIEG